MRVVGAEGKGRYLPPSSFPPPPASFLSRDATRLAKLQSCLHTDLRKVRYFEDRAEFLLRKCKPEDKTDFVLQTFLELSKDGWSVCTNGRVAASVEKMVPFASAEATGCLLKVFTKELEPLFSTKFAHHVLHAALRHCTSQPDLRQDELISSCIIDYLDFMWDNYAIFLQQSHASPALRVYLQLLSGVNIPKSPHTGLYEVDKVTLTDPLDPTSSDRITDLTNQFLLSESFNAFVVDPMSGAFLQTLIIVCWKRLEKDFEAICSNILRRSQLLKASDDAEVLKLDEKREIRLPMGFSHPVAVFFMETLISLLPGRLLRKFLHNHLLTMPSLSEGSTTEVSVVSALAGHENACRVLRATIRAVRRASDLKEIMSALQLPGIGETGTGLRVALDSGQHYLLIALAEACRRCSGSSAEAVQATCEKILLEAFEYVPKTKANDQLIKSIVRLKRQPELKTSSDGEEEEKKPPATECKLAGCLLAEEVLSFTHHRPTRLAISLASLPAAEMVAWARNHMLHRVIESALLSPSVPEQRKLQIFACLKPQLGTLAMDQSGSRVVEALWRSSEASASKPSTGKEMLSLREEIARCLAPLADRLAGAKFGRFVENLVASAVYRTNPQRWRQVKLAEASTNTTKAKEQTAGGLGSSVKRRQSQTDLQKREHLAKKQKH
ncbi:Nucleolar protein 9 [Echinococcus granulosus]|uniref:Armadillo domain containing protein n=1 Tax=Echinococcus granulosus TaxID=6210 RepID=A0A068WBS3_ECHGR|nr:Nucleolar protein 9 [Echinococcus granulosus]CDS15052.1 Armadillo domain containing protein [Echinococcus granulosus]